MQYCAYTERTELASPPQCLARADERWVISRFHWNKDPNSGHQAPSSASSLTGIASKALMPLELFGIQIRAMIIQLYFGFIDYIIAVGRLALPVRSAYRLHDCGTLLRQALLPPAVRAMPGSD
jgi:hypothetical protein